MGSRCSWLAVLLLKEAGSMAVFSKVVRAGPCSASSTLASAAFLDSLAPISEVPGKKLCNVHKSETKEEIISGPGNPRYQTGGRVNHNICMRGSEEQGG